MFRRSRWVTVAMLLAATGFAHAGSRYGGASDDSVCDVGDMAKRAAGIASPEAYIRASCRNGQVLIGSSVVTLGAVQSDIAILAIRSCAAADIEIRRSTESIGGLTMEVERVRCRLSKLGERAPRASG